MMTFGKTARQGNRPFIFKFTLTPVIFAFTVLGGLLSGCHPCSMPGACEPTFTEAVAYVGDKGDIYFDIPIRKNYKRTELTSFGVGRVNDKGFADPIWTIERPGYTPEGVLDVVTDYIPLPLRYGQNIAGIRVLMPPEALNNGLYAIGGFILVYDAKGKHHFYLMGRFSYDNGTVQNLND